VTRQDRIEALDRQIEDLEQRVLLAATIEAARLFHERLDLLRREREQAVMGELRRLVAGSRS
jgi:uncharacterized membrane protein